MFVVPGGDIDLENFGDNCVAGVYCCPTEEDNTVGGVILTEGPDGTCSQPVCCCNPIAGSRANGCSNGACCYCMEEKSDGYPDQETAMSNCLEQYTGPGASDVQCSPCETYSYTAPGYVTCNTICEWTYNGTDWEQVTGCQGDPDGCSCSTPEWSPNIDTGSTEFSACLSPTEDEIEWGHKSSTKACSDNFASWQCDEAHFRPTATSYHVFTPNTACVDLDRTTCQSGSSMPPNTYSAQIDSNLDIIP